MSIVPCREAGDRTASVIFSDLLHCLILFWKPIRGDSVGGSWAFASGSESMATITKSAQTQLPGDLRILEAFEPILLCLARIISLLCV